MLVPVPPFFGQSPPGYKLPPLRGSQWFLETVLCDLLLSPLTNMITTESIDEVRETITDVRRRGQTIGLVPTMGALHPGHLSLVEAAGKECDFVVGTLFVNPTQFNELADFQRYPRPLESDLKVFRESGVDLVFHPTTDTMYPPGTLTSIDVDRLAGVLEGQYRPGHFRGVVTVVLKLFNIVLADFAYFGRKDYQQQLLIRRVCRDLNVPIEIRTCPTIREPDGLALSSRNVHLDAAERATATALSRSLREAQESLGQGELDIPRVQRCLQESLRQTPGIELDYAVIVDGQTLDELTEPSDDMVGLVAARVGKTRLIDNMPLS